MWTTGQSNGPVYYCEGAKRCRKPATFNAEYQGYTAQMEKSSKIIKVFVRRKTDFGTRHICFDPGSCQIIITKSVENDKSPKRIDIDAIREVNSVDSAANLNNRIVELHKRDRDLREFPSNRFMYIYYGYEFNWSLFICMFESADLCRCWVDGVRYLTSLNLYCCYEKRAVVWLHRQFDFCLNHVGKVSTRDFRIFLKRNQVALETLALSELRQKAFAQRASDSSTSGRLHLTEKLTMEDLWHIYKDLIYVHAIFSENFSKYSQDSSSIRLNDLRAFLEEEQMEENVDIQVVLTDLFYRDVMMVPLNQQQLTKEEFINFLFSPENTALAPVHQAVCQDMNQPLCYYWIASSHNTYLTGDQLKSDSSLEAYANTLLKGCRCIELDCWNGGEVNGQRVVIIFHGYTLTSRLKLCDVLDIIKQYAFVASDYPLILSIEDNCSLEYQRQMAIDFKNAFGDLLVTEKVDKNETQLPSPSSMKRKIILKHKKLPKENEIIVPEPSTPSIRGNEDDQSNAFDEESMLAHPDTQKRGVLKVYDSDKKQWREHIFAATHDRLMYSESAPSELFARDIVAHRETLQRQDSTMDDSEDFEVEMENTAEDMHITELWFHRVPKNGEYRDGRQYAKALLLKHINLGNGTYMIRDSEMFPGDFTISFLYDARVNHVRIRSTHRKNEQGDSVKYYYIRDRFYHETLYDLVVFFQHHPLSTPSFVLECLKTACPQPTPHESEIWFSGDIHRDQAENLLNQLPIDGAFLVRKSKADNACFTLSFRVDNAVKHCRIKQEGRLFSAGMHQFENMVNFVEYYKTHAIYRGVCLSHPVSVKNTKEKNFLMVQANGTYVEIPGPQGSCVISKYPYTAKTDRELTFAANTTMKLLTKHGNNPDWWRCELDGKTGNVPVAYVAELPNEPGMQGTIVQFEHELRTVDANTLSECKVLPVDVGQVDASLNPPYELLFQIESPSFNLILMAQSKDDCSDWVTHLQQLVLMSGKHMKHVKSLENERRIASDLSDLVCYCQSRDFISAFRYGNYYEMCSFTESSLRENIENRLAEFNLTQISRVYPRGTRVNSSNYNPVPCWNTGCQMVALNYQTPDKSMQLNDGKFMMNGRCGYVLKPRYMTSEYFNPIDALNTVIGNVPITLTIRVIGGRHLTRSEKNRSIVCPLVEVETVGIQCDCQTRKSHTVEYDGLRPLWNYTCEFNLFCPEMALLRFVVLDEDFLGSDPFLGQAVFPVEALRSGYRSVPLRNIYSELIPMASLLIHIDIRQNERDANGQFASNSYSRGRSYSQHRDSLTGQTDTIQCSPNEVNRMLQQVSMESQNSGQSRDQSSDQGSSCLNSSNPNQKEKVPSQKKASKGFIFGSKKLFGKG